jgi:DNA-binding NarL/FixJ family response regulator
MAYRVMVVEDDPAMRRSLCDKVERHAELCIVGAAGSLRDGRTLIAERDADVVLVDLGLPDGDGTELIRLAADRGREVMVITVFGDDRHVIAAIEAGATGYLLKDADADGICDAILKQIDGGSPISPSIARRLLARFRPQDSPVNGSEAVHLTERETEVLQMVSRGLSNNEIASLLGMSFHTVASHVKHIYRKLAVGSRSEAVFEAVSQGIIRLNRD